MWNASFVSYNADWALFAVYESWETFTLYTIRIGCGTLLSLINRLYIYIYSFLTAIDHIVILQTKYEHDTDKTTPIDIHMLAPVHINIYTRQYMLIALQLQLATKKMRKKKELILFPQVFVVFLYHSYQLPIFEWALTLCAVKNVFYTQIADG